MKKIIITGDFNIDIAKTNNFRDNYIKTLLSNDLIQHVNAFTRVKNLTNTIIDHVISNINDIKTIVSHFPISDHQIIFTLWGEHAKNRPGKSGEMNKIIKKLHYKNTVTNLRNFNWNYWSEKTKNLDVNATFNSFQEAIKSYSAMDDSKNTSTKATA